MTLGAMLPLSGAAKASLAVSYNLRWLLALFLPVFTGDPPSVLYLVAHPFYGFGERAARMVQMLAPALVCVIELASLARRRRQRELPGELLLVAGAAAGVCLKALYNFFFVLAWAQGQWYYVVSVAVANLILVLWVDQAVTRSTLSTHPGKGILWLAANALLILLSFNIFISRRNTEGAASDLVLLRDPSPLTEELRKLGANRIIEYDDGFTNFVAQQPALAGLGLALDASAAEALREGNFLTMAYQRGYRVVVAHGAYIGGIEGARQDLQKSNDPRFAVLQQREFEKYRLEPVGGDGSSDALQYYRLVAK